MLKPKQRKFFDAFRSGQYFVFCLAGSTGAGKTFPALGILHHLCCNLSGVRFAVFRKSEKNLKLSTIPSYNEVKRLTKSSNDSYVVDLVARYPRTGSEILFLWADSAKDPELNNVRGLNLTGALFEEGNETDEKYFHFAKTRVGRWNNHKCKPFILVTLNPSLGWCKEIFYDPWANGTLPSNYYFSQFSIEDNDSLDPNFIKNLEDLPEEEYKRFVKNIWDYSDIPNQLIKYEWYRQCINNNYTIQVGDYGRLSVDPAWEGDDSTVFAQMHGNHIGWWEEYPKQDPDISGVLAWQRAQEFKIDHRDIIVDPIGIGAATVTKLRNDLKCAPDLFVAGAEACNMFGVLEIFNQRSEAHWILREAMRLQEITFQHHSSFQRQCLALKYSVDEKKIRIRPKDEIKEEIHESPGFTDTAAMLVHRWKTRNPRLMKQLLDRQDPQKLNFVKTHTMTRANLERMQKIRQMRTG